MDEITKGFNHGFILNKYSPELSDKIATQFNGSDYELAVDKGMKESERERKIEQLYRVRKSSENEREIDLER